MEYRTLGAGGAAVSAYALGTMTFGKEADEETSFALADDYLAAGGNFIDTADVYSAGVSEQIIGRWLAARSGARDQVVLATKGRFPSGPGADSKGPNSVGTSRRHLRCALDASLARLGVDHIDLYQMHAWDPITPIDETLRFLDDAVTAGKIGYYGFSNYTGWQLTKAVHAAREHGWNAPVTLQPQYNLLVRGIEAEIIPAALDAGLGLLPWSPLAGGWLTGKYRRDTEPTGATRLGENPERGMEAWQARNAKERTWRIIDTVVETARSLAAEPSQVALAWLAQQPAVTSVILGARSRDQLAANLAAADVVLDADQLKQLTEVSAPVLDDYPYGVPGVAQRGRTIAGGR